MSQPDTRIIGYTPNPSAVAFHNARLRVKAVCGPVGSGKTSAAAWEVLLLAQESTVAIRALVLRESYRELHDSTLKTWQEWFDPISVYRKQDEKILFTIPGIDGIVREHEIHFRHARRVEDASKFLSTEYALIWLEECVPAFERTGGIVGGGLPKGVFDISMMRVRQKGAARHQILCTFNPPSKYHWCYQTFFEQTPEELERRSMGLFRQPARENAANLPDGYYEQLEETLDPDLRRRFVEGECVTVYPGDRVFRSFFEQVHFREGLRPVDGVPLVFSFDFGRTPCCLISQVLPNSRLLVLQEIQMQDCGVERLAEMLSGTIKRDYMAYDQWRCWGDPAGAAANQTDEKTCFSVLATHGFNVLPGAIDYAARLEAVTQRSQRHIDGEPAILIDRHRCPILMEGLLGGYRYPKGVDGTIAPRPLKNHFSHLCDALQYLCTGEFDVRSGRLKGEIVKPRTIPKYNPFEPFKRKSGAGSWMAN